MRSGREGDEYYVYLRGEGEEEVAGGLVDGEGPREGAEVESRAGVVVACRMDEDLLQGVQQNRDLQFCK